MSLERVGELAKFGWADRHLLREASLLVWQYRLMLWLLPFAKVRPHIIPRKTRATPAPGSANPSPRRVARAVRAAARLVPSATCLTQALAAHRLCARYGHTSALRFGTGRSECGDFIAHAWLECNGEVLIGAAGLERFVPLHAPPEDHRHSLPI